MAQPLHFRSNSATTLAVAASPTMPEPSSKPTRYCCFIIPSRFGFFISTVLLCLISGTLAGVGWAIANKLDQALSELQRLAIFIHIFIYVFVAVFCLLGIYASITKNRNYTFLFGSFILGEILFGIASGALCMYILFHPDPALLSPSTTTSSGIELLPTDFQRCTSLLLQHPSDAFFKALCNRTRVIKGLCVGILIFTWIFQLVVVYISRQYEGQLAEEELVVEIVKPGSIKDNESFYY